MYYCCLCKTRCIMVLYVLWLSICFPETGWIIVLYVELNVLYIYLCNAMYIIYMNIIYLYRTRCAIVVYVKLDVQ